MGGLTRRTFTQGALAGIVGIAGTAACGVGPQAGGSGGADALKSKGPVTLKLNYRTEMYVPTRANEFTEKYPNVKVDLLTDTGELTASIVSPPLPSDLIT